MKDFATIVIITGLVTVYSLRLRRIMTKYMVPLAHVVIATECSIVDYAVNSKIFVYVMAWIAVVVDWTSRVMQPEHNFPQI